MLRRNAWVDWLLVAAAWALVAACCCGGEIKIIAPSAPVQLGEWAELGVSGLGQADLPKAKLLHYPRDGARLRGVLTWGGEASLDFRAAKPGKYLVAVAIGGPAGLQYAEAEVTVGTPQPEPKPDPKPEPKPDPKPDPKPNPQPVPDPKDLWCVIVEESSERTPQQATVILSQELRSHFVDRFRLADKDTPVAQGMQSYIDRAKGRSLPQMFLADETGQVYWEGPLPGTVADALKLIEKTKRGER